jgi:uncharacterized protein involved in exopolysaccharide biosynthesis
MTSTQPRGDLEKDGLLSALDVLWRRAPWGVGVAAFVLTVSATILILARPVYVAEARLRLGEPPPTTGVSPTSGLLSFLRMGGDPFANDLELLSSRSLAESVVRDGLLNLRLDAPRGWHRDSIFAGIVQVDTTARARYRVTWVGEREVEVEAVAPEPEDLGRHPTGEPIDFGGVRASFRPRDPDGPSVVDVRLVPVDEAVRVERSRIRVQRTRREANVLEISYRHHDPAIARRTVEATVRDFLAMRVRIFQRESDETVDSLRAVARITQGELRDAEEALEATQRTSGLVALEPQSEALVERYESAYEALLLARTEQDALRLQLARVEQADSGIDAWSTIVAHPRFLENETVAGLLERLTVLAELQTEALSLRTPQSREAATLDAQLAQLEGALRSVVDEYRVALGERVVELQRQHDALEALLRRLPAQAVELGRRLRDVRILSEVVVLTEQRLRQEELRLALAFSNVQVIDPPALRFRPVWPRRTFGMAIGIVLAGLSGLAAVVLVERADSSVRRASVLAALTGAPVLATPVGRRASFPLTDAERSAIDAVATAPVLVPIAGAERWSAAAASSLGRDPSSVARVVDYASARAAATSPAVLVVAAGRTSEHAVRRTVELIREAGGSVAGSIVVCRSAREAEGMWS